MKNFFIGLAFCFIVVTSVVSPLMVAAQTPDMIGLQYTAEAGLPKNDVRTSVARIINVVIGLLGIITTIIILYAGFTWMTAMGNEDKAADARRMIITAVIGLIVLLSAYTISRFVLTRVYTASTSQLYPGVRY